MKSRPLIGVGVFLTHPDHPNKILLGKRKGAHGAGQWSLPGGHLEYGEDFQTVCRREVKEETNLDLANVVQKVDFTNDLFPDIGKHYVTLFFTASCSGVAKNMEPDKCDGWRWVEIDKAPRPLFPPLEQMLTEMGKIHFKRGKKRTK
jgi:8-oxo-dGTP diphosphatase